MTRHIAILSIATAWLTGCAMTPPPAPASSPEAEQPTTAMCDAAAVKSFVGENATGKVGAEILARSGAKSLRWGPPRSAWTMDYREDRVNVRYDDDMVITEVTCG